MPPRRKRVLPKSDKKTKEEGDRGLAIDSDEDKIHRKKKSKGNWTDKTIKVSFEHWAAELIADLRQVFGTVEAAVNLQKPRRGSFEVSVIKDDGTEVCVWTGLKKGPPRKLKFPESAELVDAIQKEL